MSAARLRSRWRKLRQDPAAFALDLPWPLARAAAVGTLAAATGAQALLDRRTATVNSQWRRAGVSLVRDGAAYAAVDRNGESPSSWPSLLEVAPAGRAMVLCAIGEAGGLLGASTMEPELSAILPVHDQPVRLLAYALGGEEPLPQRLQAAPVGRGRLLARARASGAGLEEALRSAWPVARRRNPEPSVRQYAAWIAANEPGPADLRRLGGARAKIEDLPKISILMPVHDPRPEHLAAAVDSVKAQIHTAWELCVADDGSASAPVRAALDVAAQDPRVRMVRLPMGRGVAAATNAALELATGDVVLFLDHDDVLAPHALAEIAAAFAGDSSVAAAYSDEDTIDADGRRSAPLFKPDFDRERLYAQNYVNHAFAIRTRLLRELGGLREGFDGSQDHDLVLRTADAGAGPIVHVPRILYHWRIYPGGRSLSQGGAAAIAASRIRAVAESLQRSGRASGLAVGSNGYIKPVQAVPTELRSVSAIIPTRDRPGLLRACVAGLMQQTDYPSLDVQVVDNGSRDSAALEALAQLQADPRAKVLRVDAPFNFSALCNAAAAQSTADLLLFLNDDVLVVEPSWLKRMAALAVLPHVGAVGAKLRYADGRLQHAGLVLGLGPQGVAGHEFRGQAGDAPGPQARLQVTREVSAVTAACLVVERRKFEAVGGFDERLAVAFNDVDFCLRLRQAGWRNVWTPHAALIHLESATRGRDVAPEQAQRFQGEVALMHARWGPALSKDPYYNPNLTLQDESFGLAAVSRAPALCR